MLIQSSAILLFTLAVATVGQTQQQVSSDASPVAGSWSVNFTPPHIEAHMDTQVQSLLELKNINASHNNYRFQLHSDKPNLASVSPNVIELNAASWSGNITIEAIFLGQTNITVELIDTVTNASWRSGSKLQLTIIRKQRVIDHVFTGSVALLVSLLYINFGAALDLTVLRGLIGRPIGPTIGFVMQFVLMPLLSYALGLLIFPGWVEMQLGLFFTGVSPSGGASNIWAVILGGNINLSVLMTTISNFAAFGMMPFWLFTLGALIFNRGNMHVPYSNIATFAVALIVPLAVGVGIQKWSPRLTRMLVRLLKPISSCLIIFIIIFAIATNLYLFQLFSWQIVLSGLGLPWLGYICAWLLAKALRQTNVDALTIAIETGIQNTGISIFLLRFSLPQPQADLTTVIPVAVAIMTPFPLLALYIYKRCTQNSIKDGLDVGESQHITASHSS